MEPVFVHQSDGSRIARQAARMSFQEWMPHRICGLLDELGASSGSVPWLTLVLGSELLTPPFPFRPEDVALAVSRAIKDGLDISEQEAKETGIFVLSLQHSRRSLDLSSDIGPTAPSKTLADFMKCSLTDDHLTALVDASDTAPTQASAYSHPRRPQLVAGWLKSSLLIIHATAALNSSYFLAKLAQQIPVNRWEDEGVRFEALGLRSEVLKQRWSIAKSRLEQARTELKKLSDALEECKTAHDGAIDRLDRSGDVDVLQELADTDERDALEVGSVNKLVTGIITGLTPDDAGVIRSSNLLTLTEVAWSYIVDHFVASSDNNSYVGWAEQLLAIGLAEKFSQDLPVHRPSLSDAKNRQNGLRSLLNCSTRRRAAQWAELTANASLAANAPKANDLNEAYQVYSGVLATQALRSYEARQRQTRDSSEDDQAAPTLDDDDMVIPSDDEADDQSSPTDDAGVHTPRPSAHLTPPPGTAPAATAYVTTFDLELEIALCFTTPQTPFVVILPCELRGKDGRAAPFWMGYEVGPFPVVGADDSGAGIDPEVVLQAITNPPVERWFVVSDAEREQTKNPYGVSSPVMQNMITAGPLAFIIRLAGSPMVSLPDWRALVHAESGSGEDRLRTEIKSVVGPDVFDRPGQAIIHSLVLEEAQSMNATFPEFLPQAHQGLPLGLTNLVPTGYWRYWVLLGVQISEEPMRYRLVAQVSGTPNTVTPTNTFSAAIAGAAINRRRALTRRATDVLRWMSFTVVEGDVQAMSAPLEHYCRHLEHEPMAELLDDSASPSCILLGGRSR